MIDESTYLAHRFAIEGKVFYYNDLTAPQWVEKYFPPAPKDRLYKRKPKISFPVTSDVINRLTSIMFKDAVITIEPESLQVRFDEFLARNKWHSLSRDIVAKTLNGGSLLCAIRPYETQAKIETWTGEWVWMEGDEQLGYMFQVKDGKRVPVTQEPERGDDVAVIPITETDWGMIPHNFGFRPAVMFSAPDKQDGSPYALPYYLRFRDPLLEYNRVFSKMLFGIRVLSSSWKTNKSREDPNNPLFIDEGTVNYLGENGTLEQVARDGNFTPELETLDRLRNHIAASAQVPDSMTGLREVGKVESGVAMQIVNGPLIEITQRLRSDFRAPMVELLMKGFYADQVLQSGMRPQDFMINLQFTDNVIPIDKAHEMSIIQQANALGVFTPEELRSLVLPLVGLKA